MLISSSLPAVPGKLVKRINQEGHFIEMAELLTDTLISPDYLAEDNSISHKQKRKKSMTYLNRFSVLEYT